MFQSIRAVCFATLALTVAVASAQESKQPPPLGTASFTPPEGNTKLQPLTPENFVTRAAVTNMAEIELSQLALEKSADTGVKTYATQLVKDHQAAQAKLKALAAAAKIAMPGTVDEDHRKEKEKLKDLAGADFDRQFIAAMHDGHAQAAAMFEAAASSTGLSAPLKSYASDTLKAVKAHLAEAEKLHSRH